MKKYTVILFSDAGLEDFKMMKIHIVVFWVVTSLHGVTAHKTTM
jgi:hypothetical protein